MYKPYVTETPAHLHTVPQNIWRLARCAHIEFNGHGSMDMRMDILNSDESITKSFTFKAKNSAMLIAFMDSLVMIDKDNNVSFDLTKIDIK